MWLLMMQQLIKMADRQQVQKATLVVQQFNMVQDW
jgi:hypothetical protein